MARSRTRAAANPNRISPYSWTQRAGSNLTADSWRRVVEFTGIFAAPPPRQTLQEPESTCEWRDNANGFVAAGLETLRLVSNLRFQHLFVAKAALSPRTLLNSPRATKLFRQTGCGRFRMLRDRGLVFRPREIGNGDARGLGKPE